jgi:hypothetical protein
VEVLNSDEGKRKSFPKEEDEVRLVEHVEIVDEDCLDRVETDDVVDDEDLLDLDEEL